MTRNYVPASLPDSEFNVSIAYQYDLAGNQIALVDPLGTITRTYFDPLDRPITVVQNLSDWAIDTPSPPPFDPAFPDRNVPTYFDYDAVGNLVTVEDALGTISRTCYDQRNLPTKAITNPTAGDPCKPYAENSNPALDIVNTWSYDPVGNLLSWTNPVDATTYYAYDNLNRVEAITDPLGFVTTYAYDALSNLTSLIDAEGIVTKYEYDARSQLAGVIQNYKSGLGQDHEINVETSFVYDPVGNLIVHRDANHGEWSFFYDGLSRLEAKTTPLGGITGYTLDGLGNLLSQIDPNMNIVHYDYDLMDRLVEIDYATPDSDPHFTYDASGNLLSMVDGLGITTWVYDDLYRPIVINDPFGQEISTSYNAIGSRTGLTYADGRSVSYTFDAVQRLSQVQDWDGGTTDYTYDKAGRPLTAKLPNGVETVYSWDAGNRLESLVHNLNTQNLASYEYSYDRVGNRTQAIEFVRKPFVGPVMPFILFFPNVKKSEVGNPGTIIDYIYDPLYRLTSADYSSGEFFHYTYDAVGNRLNQQTLEGTNTYEYDARHRITAVDGVEFEWDPAGRLLSDGQRTFSYDHADRLTSVLDGETTTSFAYDGVGNRYQQSIDGVTTTYSLDIAIDLTQVLSDGTDSYLYGLGRIGEASAGGWQYALSDALGSTRQLTGPSGAITLAQFFEPFGAPLKAKGDGSSDFGFTGEQDAVADLVFLRARYYDPGTGRFITEDPFPGVPSLPTTLHPYQYALNNPINLVDPSGEFVVSALIGGLILGGGLAAWDIIRSNPGLSLSDYLSSDCFWRAVGIGALTGIVAGLVGGFIGGLGIFGLGLKGAIYSGMAGGFFAGLAAEGLKQVLSEGAINPLAIAASGVIGMATGGIFGAIGYKISNCIRSFFTNKIQNIKNQGFRYEPSLPAHVKGDTSWLGEIRINPTYPASDQARTLIHEQVHSFLTPRGFGQGVRAWLAKTMYNNSHLMVYLEEAIAESIAQVKTGGSLSQGLRFPISGGYVSPIRTIIEGILATTGVGGLLYGIYEATK